MTTKNYPQTVEALINALTSNSLTKKAIVPAVSVHAETDKKYWKIDFALEPDANVNYAMLYACIEKKYTCNSLGYSNRVFSIGICLKTKN